MNLRHRLMQLYRDNPLPENERRVQVKHAVERDQASIYVYGPIGGYFGIDTEQFVRDVAAIQASEIVVYVNSPGGDVFDGRAMAAALRRHEARVKCVVDGLCASAATYLATASEEVVMERGTYFMIHNGWSITIGDKNDHAQTYWLLDDIDGEIARDYARYSGKEIDQIVEWMNAETWFNPQAALDAGFAHRIAVDSGKEDDEDDVANRLGKWNLSVYENAPRGSARRPLRDERKPPRPESLQVDRAAMLRRLDMRQRLAS